MKVMYRLGKEVLGQVEREATTTKQKTPHHAHTSPSTSEQIANK